jgi:thiamine biosynthesis lipoprotein
VTALVLVCSCGGPARGARDWSTAGGIPAAAVVHARGERDVEALLSDLRTSIDRSIQDLDPRAAGELARLNRDAAEGFRQGVPIDLYACVNLALGYAGVSRGAYDPTVGALRRLYETRWGTPNPPRPTEVELALGRGGWEKLTLEPEAFGVRFRAPGLELDLGPVGWGCALDWAARRFARPGSLAGWMQVDGVHRAWRHPPDEPAWSIPLEDPRAPGRELLSIRVVDRGVAVCGQVDPEHVAGGAPADRPPLLDPRTGHPTATDLLAVVTTADSAGDAAGLCQAVYVAGSLEGPAILAEMRRVEAVLLVRADAAAPYAVASAALGGRIELSAELVREIAGDVRYLLP